MARTNTTIDEIVRAAVTDAIRRITPAIQRQVAAYAAEELERNLAVNGARARQPTSARPPRRTRGEDLTKWVADRNARRVPKVVIEGAGGLDTEHQIVASVGENAAC